jgi:hypothetical protein
VPRLAVGSGVNVIRGPCGAVTTEPGRISPGRARHEFQITSFIRSSKWAKIKNDERAFKSNVKEFEVKFGGRC